MGLWEDFVDVATIGAGFVFGGGPVGAIAAGAYVLGKRQDQANSQAANQAADAQLEGLSGAERALREQQGLSESALTKGYDEAGRAVQRGYEGANQGLLRGYNQYTTAMQPWAKAGGTALDRYMSMISQPVNMATDPVFAESERLLKQRMAAMGVSQGPSSVASGYSPLISDLYQRQQAEKYNQLNALGQVMNYGYNATSGIGQAGANLGTAQAGLSSQLGATQAELAAGRGSQLANLYGNLGANLANLATGRGEVEGSRSLANVDTTWGNIGKGLGIFAGMGGANLFGGQQAPAQTPAPQQLQPFNFQGSPSAFNYQQTTGPQPLSYPQPSWQQMYQPAQFQPQSYSQTDTYLGLNGMTSPNVSMMPYPQPTWQQPYQGNKPSIVSTVDPLVAYRRY